MRFFPRVSLTAGKNAVDPASSGNAVIAPRRCCCHISVGKILAQQFAVAGRGRTVAAGARRLHDDAASSRHREGTFAVEGPSAAVGQFEPELHRPAGPPAGEAEGRRETALAAYRGMRLVAEHAPY